MEYSIEDTLIVINSSKRLHKICTHSLFPKGVINWVVAVPHDQYKDYEKVFGRDHTYCIPKTVPSFLSSQRQHVMEYFGQVYKYIWLMDDDLTFLKRNEEMKLRKCGDESISEMFQLVRKHLTTVPVVAVSTRLGNNRVTKDFDETGRVTRCYAMSTKAFKDVGASFAPFEPFLAQDFHMTLCFLNKGYNNRILYTFAQQDFNSNADGGCSTYRTPALLEKVSHWMAANHPEVRTKVKPSKNWKGFGDFRVDMVVQWKKAYKPRTKPTGGLAAKFKRGKK